MAGRPLGRLARRRFRTMSGATQRGEAAYNPNGDWSRRPSVEWANLFCSMPLPDRRRAGSGGATCSAFQASPGKTRRWIAATGIRPAGGCHLCGASQRVSSLFSAYCKWSQLRKGQGIAICLGAAPASAMFDNCFASRKICCCAR
jgi:hypothetical protein